MEGAKIHAENSIRQKNQALNYRRMSARIDAVAARVQTAVTTKQVTTGTAEDISVLLSNVKRTASAANISQHLLEAIHHIKQSLLFV